MVERRRLPFPILSDTEGRFAAALALPFATGGETYLRRLTLIVVNGRIERVFYPVPEPALHAGEVLRSLAKRLVLCVLDRITEAVEPFLEIVGQ